MCGIAGIFKIRGDATDHDRSNLDRMLATMHTRGPDARGVAVVSSRAIIGANRLRITDHLNPLADQPFATNSGRVTACLNGEIYNHVDLRSRLAVPFFRTRSDTETLAEYFEQRGGTIFSTLEGMFACALYDSNDHTLTLAVDASRQKPLFIADIGEVVIFSSTIEGILATDYAQWEFDILGIGQVIAARFSLGARTHIRSISEIRPGTFVTVGTGTGLRETTYLSLGSPDRSRSLEQIALELAETVKTSVRETICAELPVALLLSGGVDSSAIASIATDLGATLSTFSIGFEATEGEFSDREQTFDEFYYSRTMAERMGSQHHEFRVSTTEYFEWLDRWIDTTGEAYSALESVCLLFLYQKVSQAGIRIAVTGTGVDELFEGYGYGERMRDVPRSELARSYFDTFGWTHSVDLKRLLPRFYDDIRCAGTEEIESILRQHGGDDWSSAELTQLLNTFIHLGDCEHRQTDTASMAWSVEARAPLSSKRLIELGMSTPYEFKMREGIGKYVFKKAVDCPLLKDITWRPKRGFPVPAALKFSDAFESRLNTTLTENSLLCRAGIVDFNYMNEIQHHRSDNFRNVFWRLYVIERLLERQRVQYSVHMPSVR